MTEKQIRAFLALAETLSFAQAAQRIHMSQPAFSLAVKSLEAKLGGKLFSRTTRRVRLTPEGEMLLPRAQHLLAAWTDTEELLRHRFTLQTGHVTIAAMPSFAANYLPELLSAYRRRYPRVDIAIQDVIHEEVLEMVAKGQVELGIAFEPESLEQFHFAPLFVDRFVAAVPRKKAFNNMRAIGWRELLEHPFITLQRPSTVRQLLERSLSVHGIDLHATMECHQLATVGGLVARGLGVSAVPMLCKYQMQRLGARIISLHSPSIQRNVGLIMRNQADLSTATRAMFELGRLLPFGERPRVKGF